MAWRHSELSSSLLPDERLLEGVTIFTGDWISEVPTNGANVEALRPDDPRSNQMDAHFQPR